MDDEEIFTSGTRSIYKAKSKSKRGKSGFNFLLLTFTFFSLGVCGGEIRLAIHST